MPFTGNYTKSIELVVLFLEMYWKNHHLWVILK